MLGVSATARGWSIPRRGEGWLGALFFETSGRCRFSQCPRTCTVYARGVPPAIHPSTFNGVGSHCCLDRAPTDAWANHGATRPIVNARTPTGEGSNKSELADCAFCLPIIPQANKRPQSYQKRPKVGEMLSGGQKWPKVPKSHWKRARSKQKRNRQNDRNCQNWPTQPKIDQKLQKQSNAVESDQNAEEAV